MLDVRPLVTAVFKAVGWFAVALFVAAWIVHPSGPLALDEAALRPMTMPGEVAGPFTGLVSWFSGAYNYVVRVIQQDARPAMDHLLLRQLPSLLHAIGDLCYSPSGAASTHAAAVAFWLVVDTCYNALLLAITLVNVILLTPKTALSFVWGIPVSLWLLVQSALFASPQTTLRIGGAACLAVAAVFFARAVRALLAARAAAASGAQQVVVEETPLDGLEALRRSMASYDQAVRGLPPLLYQTAASNPAIAPELLASSEKLFAAESALDDVEEMFKGKGVVAYTTTVTTNAQVLKLGPAGPQPMAGPKGPAATIVSPPRAALGAKAQGGALTPTLPPPPPPAAAAAPKPAPPAAAAPTPAAQAKPASGFQPQMTVADRAAESMYMQTVESSGKYSVENYRKVATEVTAALDMLKPVATFVSVSEGSATSVDGDESRDGNAGGQRGKDERGR